MLHVMADTTELEALIARLANDRTLQQRREASTRAGAIDPTLSALGWNVHDLNEVDPEFKDSGGGWADYCLRGRGRDLVLIEAKRASADLSQHEDQLQRYAFGLSVDLAVLTNGLEWWLYLPTKGGRSFGRRRFARVDFRTQDPGEAASGPRPLSQPRCLREWYCAARGRGRVRAAGARRQDPRGFTRGVEQRSPSSQLRDLLAREVARIAGVQPHPSTIGEYLAKVSASGTPTPDRGDPPRTYPARQMHPSSPMPTVPAPRSGTARPSPADQVVALLEEAGEPLHYREIERRLRETGRYRGRREGSGRYAPVDGSSTTRGSVGPGAAPTTW